MFLFIDNETCEVLLPEETCPSTLKKTKKKASIEAEYFYKS
jgi:hypothetical protein